MTDPKPFQLATVDAALQAFHRKKARFLVADEVGLGKTVVAQQIIQEMISRKRCPLVVLYVCSNLSIAAQNRRKLVEILPKDERGSAHCSVDRLTLVPIGDPPSNSNLHLYTLTPETSIPIRKNRRRDGRQEERALIHCLVKRLWPQLLRGKQKHRFKRNAIAYWKDVVRKQRERIEGNLGLVRAFYDSVRTEFDIKKGQHTLPKLNELADLDLIAHMRNALAACAIEGLRPDLIIFDEFQNFKDLLSQKVDKGARRVIEKLRGEDPNSEAALLLLSATPYQLYTRNRDVSAGVSHHKQFFDLVEFLYGRDTSAKAKRKQCEKLFMELQISMRRQEFDIATASQLRTEIQRILMPIMSRTERTSHDDGWSDHTTSSVSAPLVGGDMRIYRHLSQAVSNGHASTAVAYWSSIPLPAQTMGSRYKAWDNAEKQTAPASLPQLTKDMRDELKLMACIPHPKIRALFDLLDSDALQLPWLPPSLPWWPLKGQWHRSADNLGKILIFSRFRAVPQAIASLISYEVESRLFSGDGTRYEDITERRLLQPGPERHALLGYFHPSPWLVENTDPLASSERVPSRMRQKLKSQIISALDKLGIRINKQLRRNRSMWILISQIENKANLWKDISRSWSKVHSDIGRGVEEQGLGKLLRDWNEQAQIDIDEISKRELQDLIKYALCSPGVVVGRALKRYWPDAVCKDGFYYTLLTSWQGLRNYLDNPLFATKMRGSEVSYPSAIMKAVRNGNLEAVMDEQLWLLRTLYSLSGPELAKGLLDGLQLRSGTFRLHELKGNWKNTFSLRCHVAMPFTEVRAVTLKGMEMNDRPLRTDDIRRAFNTPFWPYVLATTSVGQEGLDFHAWCSSLAHWDLSHNPVDLEQREGRIQRFAGHSIRKRIATQIGTDIWSKLTAGDSPWQRLAEEAERKLSDNSGLCPWWVCRGADVNRYVFEVPSSEQKCWLEVMKKQRMLYRLILGQPEQEDLLNLLSSTTITTTDMRNITLELSAYFSSRPEYFKFIESSSMIGKIEEIKEEIKQPKKLSEYNRFCQEKRLEGHTFSEIANLWRKRTKQWDKDSFMEEMETKVGRTEANIANNLLNWASGMQLEPIWLKTVNAQCHLVVSLYDEQYKIFSVSTELGGRIWNRFFNHSKYPPFDLEEKRREFLKRLNSIEGISISSNETVTNTSSIMLSNLNNEPTFKGFIESYEWFINEIKTLRKSG